MLPLDAEGRRLFVPWRPFSRWGYVLPDAQRATAIERSLWGWTIGSLLVLGLVSLLTTYGQWWPSVELLATWLAAVLVYAWLVRRWTRGLERVRYEPPPG